MLQQSKMKLSKEFGRYKKEGLDIAPLQASINELKSKKQSMEEEVKTLEDELTSIALGIPNLPDENVPDGADENENVVLEIIGEKPEFSFEPKEHWDLDNGWLDFERGVNLASSILTDNGIDNTNSKILNLSNEEAKNELLKGNIDVMFVVSSHKSEIIKELLASPSVNVFSFKRARAYSQKYTFLEDLTLYEGTLDLYKNLPDQNINLLSSYFKWVVIGCWKNFISNYGKLINKKMEVLKSQMF